MQGKRVSAAQLQAIENQLFTLVRQQAKRNQPIELPRADFWTQVALLLSNIDNELSTIGSTEGWSVKAQNMSRRQANVRRAVADLTQHRLTALVRHAATNNLEAAPHGDVTSDANQMLPPLDWQRHDSAERAFYEGLNSLIERYKHHVSWNTLQNGLLSEGDELRQVKPGTTQLDSFIEEPGGLTGRGAPKLNIEQPETPSYRDPDEDEEDRIARMSAYPTSGLAQPDFDGGSSTQTSPIQPPPQPSQAKPSQSQPSLTQEAVVESPTASPPLSSDSTAVTDEGVEATSNSQTAADEEVESQVDGAEVTANRIRIRMVQDLPAPIVDTDGRELNLMTGDIEFLDSDFAAGLVAAGLAENAAL